MAESTTAPQIAILLATYNGAQFLSEQLDSFARQTHPHWSLWVNDDGSTDGTRDLIIRFAADQPRRTVSLADGPKAGYQRNFLNLLLRAGEAPYYAFSDQDDIWEPDHLARALAWLETIPSYVPAVYGARTLYVTHENKPLYLSALFKKKPCFANALVQSIAGANTMVMNRAARNLLAASADAVNVIGHDWWAYMLVTGAGGVMHYDPEPALRYRQHANNLLGQNVSLKAKLWRIRGLMDGKFKGWNDTNLAALATVRASLTPATQTTLDRFTRARKRSLFPRLWGLWRSGIHRQTLLGNVGLIVAAVTGRL